MTKPTNLGAQLMDEVGKEVEWLEHHQSVVWLQKFVPIYLFHFLLSIGV